MPNSSHCGSCNPFDNTPSGLTVNSALKAAKVPGSARLGRFYRSAFGSFPIGRLGWHGHFLFAAGLQRQAYNHRYQCKLLHREGSDGPGWHLLGGGHQPLRVGGERFSHTRYKCGQRCFCRSWSAVFLPDTNNN